MFTKYNKFNTFKYLNNLFIFMGGPEEPEAPKMSESAEQEPDYENIDVSQYEEAGKERADKAILKFETDRLTEEGYEEKGDTTEIKEMLDKRYSLEASVIDSNCKVFQKTLSEFPPILSSYEYIVVNEKGKRVLRFSIAYGDDVSGDPVSIKEKYK